MKCRARYTGYGFLVKADPGGPGVWRDIRRWWVLKSVRFKGYREAVLPLSPLTVMLDVTVYFVTISLLV